MRMCDWSSDVCSSYLHLCLDQYALCVDGHYPRLVGVEQPALVVVVGPTDFVTFNDGQRFALEERQPAIVCARPQARGIELAKPSFPVLKHELLPRMVNGLDGVVTLGEFLGAVARAKVEDHAWLVSAKIRSEEHTSELQSLMRISYAV